MEEEKKLSFPPRLRFSQFQFPAFSDSPPFSHSPPLTQVAPAAPAP